jgi:hypothetical protein
MMTKSVGLLSLVMFVKKQYHKVIHAKMSISEEAVSLPKSGFNFGIIDVGSAVENLTV